MALASGVLPLIVAEFIKLADFSEIVLVRLDLLTALGLFANFPFVLGRFVKTLAFGPDEDSALLDLFGKASNEALGRFAILFANFYHVSHLPFFMVNVPSDRRGQRIPFFTRFGKNYTTQNCSCQTQKPDPQRVSPLRKGQSSAGSIRAESGHRPKEGRTELDDPPDRFPTEQMDMEVVHHLPAVTARIDDDLITGLVDPLLLRK